MMHHPPIKVLYKPNCCTIMKTFKSIFPKNLSVLILTLVFAAICTNAQIPNDSIVADFNEFVRLLEETHPDPYTNYGGRPFFRKAAMETRFGLAQDSVTSADELATRIREFLAPLQDGHTGVKSQQGANHKFLAPIMFQAINDGIIISRVPDEYKDYIGSRLLAIENVPIREVCDGLAKHYSAENQIGRMLLVCFRGMQPTTLRKVIPSVGDEYITYQVETAKGKRKDLKIKLMPIEQANEWYAANRKTLTKVSLPDKDLTYDFVGKGKNTMYLKLQSIMARDCFEYMQSNGWDYQEQLQRIYNFWGKEMPADANEAIAQMPSFSEEFEKMLLLMKQNGSKNLIIDLRGNDGGFTPITLPTLYQMWGDKYIEELSDFETENYTMISPLLLKKYNVSLEDISMGSPISIQYGDYQYSNKQYKVPEITEKYRNMVISQMMSSVKDKLMAQNGQPVYTPEHVYVLTDPGTFSAAFHYAFFLSKMGATIVGVTCSQAPNTYMEMTPFELPRTGLKGSISNSLQLFLPVNDPRAKDFTPDLMPTYEDYKRYNFDDNTIPLYLLDYIAGKH